MTEKPENQTPEMDNMDDSAFEPPMGDATGSAADHESAPQAGVEAEAPKKDEVDFKDKYIRLMAEMENLRKRTARDVEDARRFAVSAFARDMLDIADNLERALAVVNKDDVENEHVKNMLAGVEMVSQQLGGIFKQFKIEKTEPALGEKLNPELHQAMFEVPTDAHPHGHVAQVMQPGYTIAGRLLRPAMVGTAKRIAPEGETTPTDAEQKQA